VDSDGILRVQRRVLVLDKLQEELEEDYFGVQNTTFTCPAVSMI
jgi:hypothetical protein